MARSDIYKARLKVLFLLSLVVAAACGTPSAGDSGVGFVAQAVTAPLTVGQEISFGTPTHVTEGLRSQSETQLACGPTECLAVFRAYAGAVTMLVARRLSLAGNPIDSDVLPIGAIDYSYPTRVSASNADFLVVSDKIWRVKLSAAPGPAVSVLGEVGPQGVAAVASNQDHHLLAICQLDSVGFQVVTPSTTALTLPFTWLGAAYGKPCTYPADVSLIAGPNQYLATWTSGKAARIGLEGDALDSAPIVFAKRSASGKANGVFDGTRYILAWWFGDVFVGRVGSDGTALDPDDDFNGVTGSKSVYALPQRKDNPTVFSDGRDALVTVHAPELRGVRVDPGTGMRRVAGTGFEFQLAATEISTMTYGPSGGLLGVFPAGVSHLDVPVSPGPPVIGTAVPISYQVGAQGEPGVASDGNDYLVAWVDSQPVIDKSQTTWNVLAARVSGASHMVLDDPPLVLGTASELWAQVAVAWANGSYIVGWTDGATVRRRGVLPNGTLGAAFASGVQSDLSLATGLAAACNDEFCLLTWVGTDMFRNPRVFGSRFDATSLALVDATPAAINDYNIVRSTLSIAADRVADPAQRTFLIAYANDDYLFTLRDRSHLGLPQPEVRVVTDDKKSNKWSPPVVASSGSGFVMAYNLGYTDPVMLAKIDAFSGAIVGNPTYVAARGEFPTVVWNGKSYVVLWTGQYSSRYVQVINGTRYSPDFQAVDPVFTMTDDLLGVPWPFDGLQDASPALASNGKGNVLAVYMIPDMTSMTKRVRARFIDDGYDPNAATDAGTEAATDGGVDVATTVDGGIPPSGLDASRDGGIPPSGLDASRDGGIDAGNDAAIDAMNGGADGASDRDEMVNDGSSARDDARVSDGSPVLDARSTNSADALSTASPDAPGDSSSGCACTLPQRSASSARSSLALGAALLLLARRRQRQTAKLGRGSKLA